MTSDPPSRRPEPHWQSLARAALKVLLLEVAVAYLALGAYMTFGGSGLVNRVANPIGGDFITYYAVSQLTLAGESQAAYESATVIAKEVALVGRDTGGWPWLYPPPSLLLVAPLALLPYGVALSLWLGLTALAYGGMIGGAHRHPLAPLLALLWPVAADVAFSGQNGFLTAALLGGGLLLLERRPLLAGLLLGLLVLKPQLGLLVPVALIAGGHWRPLGVAAAVAVAAVGASVAAFGLAPWSGFSEVAGYARAVMESGGNAWFKMASVFAAARLLGLDTGLAWLAQIAAALVAVVVVARLWRRGGPTAFRGTVLVFATFWATPYAQFYDLAVLALPVAWLLAARPPRTLDVGTTTALALLWFAPLIVWSAGRVFDVPLWQPLLILVFAVLYRPLASPAAAQAP